jgi:hypothetical protein
VSHANAALTPRARLRLVRLIVDEDWPVVRAAERFAVGQRFRPSAPRGHSADPNRVHTVVRSLEQEVGTAGASRPATKSIKPRKPCSSA